ncbi:hypothetical protein ABTK05_22375, partial [Acinetobacter baumannii]
AALVITSVVVMLPVITNGSLSTFWQDTVARPVDRSSPFSIWGLWGGLGLAQHAVQALAAALAIAVAFVPRRRTVIEV